MKPFLVILAIVLIGLSGQTWAATSPSPMTMKLCLKKTDEMPDIALAEADRWFKNGGGFSAKLCHAFAQFKRGEFQLAGKEFSLLANTVDKKDTQQRASLHDQAGASYTRIQDIRDAEAEYAAALKLNPSDAGIWVDRGTERAGAERYWDAISDFNQAIDIDPKNAVALRLRGQTWVKLGNDKKADEDFLAAEDLDPLPAEPQK